jgi:hypothetical protein
MSPTSVVPGASAVKSRATRSGIEPVSPPSVVVGPGLGLARDQAQLAHDRPHQFRGDVLALTGQGGMDPTVPVGQLGVGEDRFDEGGQAGAPACGRRGRPVAPLVATTDVDTPIQAHIFTIEYRAFSASMNANFALIDTPGRRRPPLFPGTRLHPQLTYFSFELAKAYPLRDRQRRFIVDVLDPVPIHPAPESAFVHLDFAGGIEDRPRRLGHHLHGFVFELRRDLSAPFSH